MSWLQALTEIRGQVLMLNNAIEDLYSDMEPLRSSSSGLQEVMGALDDMNKETLMNHDQLNALRESVMRLGVKSTAVVRKANA